MESRESMGEDVGAPYFFLSYARTPPDGLGAPDPDLWVHRLFQDLCEHIRRMTAGSASPGFMDQRLLRHEELWSSGRAESLASCRVFVPLYSPRYFISSDCGREWGAFSRRRVAHRFEGQRGTPTAVVPALWSPVSDHQLPSVADDVEYRLPELGQRYQAFGLYGLAKLRSFRHDYQRAVLHLARRIIEVGESVVVERGDHGGLATAPDAFAKRSAATSRRLRITVAASSLDRLPAGRCPDYYGPSPLDWNPFHPDSSQPLAEAAADIVERLEFRPDLRAFGADADRLGGPAVGDGPEVLLLDRWTLRDPEHRTRLSLFDNGDRAATGLLVPWNEADPDSDEAEYELAARAESTLPRTIRQGRQASRPAVRGIPDLSAFTALLPHVVSWAAASYLRTMSVQPPPGPGVPRFRLTAPGDRHSEPPGHRRGTKEEDRDEQP